MGAEWVDYKGKKILHIKYGGLKPQEMLDLVYTAAQMIIDAKAKGMEILSLTDLTGCHTNQEFVDLSKKQGMVSLPLTKKAAVVGVTGVKNILLRAVNRVAPNPRVPFNTVEEAMEWLVK